MRRETILQTIKARLATITKTNGYTWEPKERFEWLASPLNINDLPVILVGDTKDIYDAQASSTHTHNLSIEVEVYISAKTDTASKTRQAISDVLKAVSTDNGMDMGDYLRVARTELTVDKEERTVGQGVIEFVVTYETEQWGM